LSWLEGASFQEHREWGTGDGKAAQPAPAGLREGKRAARVAVTVTVHDQVAMRTYANAWTDMRTAVLHLPRFRGIEVEKVARRMPGLVIAARSSEVPELPRVILNRCIV
jgi:hypothetical protein